MYLLFSGTIFKTAFKVELSTASSCFFFLCSSFDNNNRTKTQPQARDMRNVRGSILGK